MVAGESTGINIPITCLQPRDANLKLIKKHLSSTLLVPWCHNSDPQSLHYDANLLLTVPHCTFGDIIHEALNRVNMLFSAPFLPASSVNHRRYINDFKTRWDTIKRNYARFLSHASFNGLADFVWAQQCCYPSDALCPPDTLLWHVPTVCVFVCTHTYSCSVF